MTWLLSYMSFRIHSLATPPLPSSRNNCDSPEINFEQYKPKFWAGLLRVLNLVWEWEQTRIVKLFFPKTQLVGVVWELW